MKSINQEKVIRIFLLGNNPIELGQLHAMLEKGGADRIEIEYSFDLSRAFSRIKKQLPACLLVDDNIGILQMRKLADQLRANVTTARIPVALLKRSNFFDAGATMAREFILKECLTPALLRKSIANLSGNGNGVMG